MTSFHLKEACVKNPTLRNSVSNMWPTSKEPKFRVCDDTIVGARAHNTAHYVHIGSVFLLSITWWNPVLWFLKVQKLGLYKTKLYDRRWPTKYEAQLLWNIHAILYFKHMKQLCMIVQLLLNSRRRRRPGHRGYFNCFTLSAADLWWLIFNCDPWRLGHYAF